jgi:phosphoribosylformylglycinamidine cyclo-ligase
VPADDAYRTFNMGIGMVLIVSAADVAGTVARLREAGEPDVRVIGTVTAGEPGVVYD